LYNKKNIVLDLIVIFFVAVAVDHLKTISSLTISDQNGKIFKEFKWGGVGFINTILFFFKPLSKSGREGWFTKNKYIPDDNEQTDKLLTNVKKT
jgi:hypothetical protein